MTNFESFSEDLVPRIVPQPTLHPVLDMSKPIVPEVSLIFDESKKSIANQMVQPKSYKEWKQQQQMPVATKFTPNQTSTADRKKIVTFNLPNDNQPTKNMLQSPIESTPMAICQQLDLSLCEPRKSNEVNQHTIQSNYIADVRQQDYNHFIQQPHTNKRLVVSPQMNSDEHYKRPSNQMVNRITNQVFNNQNQAETKGITLNDVYQLLQNMQLNNSSENSTANKESNLNQLNGHHIASEKHRQIDHLSLIRGTNQSFENTPSSHNEPTMKDMFNVILKQQEQLMNIQNQVHVLLMRSANVASNQLESRHHNNNQIMGDVNANINQIDSHAKQVGVMTSLEINVQNIKPSAIQTDENFSTPKAKNKMAINQNIKQCGCMCNCESQKQLQSPDSGSNDDNFDTSPRNSSDTQAGWTFYGNILNQVNDVLQNTSPISSARGNEPKNPQQAANTENRSYGLNEVPIRRTSNVMPNIRSAQFKQVGFQIDDVNISAMTKRITFGSTSNEIPRTPADRVAATDNSMLMNALAMKYLPCDLNNVHSPKLANGVTQTTIANTRNATPTNGPSVNRQCELNNKHSNTDMSMTSYRYMEKYGLL
ncbi:protein PF3D7_1417600-like [Sitodiplosis mosellana]|uniref:protein PF3D7_1417600-like n=1 Tax=Sitodiplosis mosellana TaxID=263140 RepID=UPI0024439890|nr:protein PF3D7_1417600-like [Sitodiplosis mosellana]